jgi:hypothetical protein
MIRCLPARVTRHEPLGLQGRGRNAAPVTPSRLHWIVLKLLYVTLACSA